LDHRRTQNPFQFDLKPRFSENPEPFELMGCQMVVFGLDLDEAMFRLRSEE
jgi:hypothetical protein